MTSFNTGPLVVIDINFRVGVMTCRRKYLLFLSAPYQESAWI